MSGVRGSNVLGVEVPVGETWPVSGGTAKVVSADQQMNDE